MNMRSGIDTSMYGRSGGGSTIGEVLGGIQGVSSIFGKARERKQNQKDVDDTDYLNTTFGKHLEGWDGQDQNDFGTRINTATNEVLQKDPALFKKATGHIADAAKMQRDAEDQALQAKKTGLEIEGQESDNRIKEIGKRTAHYESSTKEIAAKKADFDYQNGIDNYIGYNLADVTDQRGLDAFFQKVLAKRNILPEQLTTIPKNYEELVEQKDYHVNSFLSGEERRKKELADYENKIKKLGADRAVSDAKISSVNADYIEREKEQGLRKGEADISKVQRDLDKPEPSAMDGIDPETGKPYTAMQNKSAAYAVSMGRGIKNIDSLVEKGFDEADFMGQVLNTFKKKKELSRFEFLNIAKTPEQRMYLQAQLDFMVPHLRDQSGAVINADEYTTEAQQYFPRPHETPQEVDQKKNARIQEFVARRTIGGSRYGQILKDYEAEMESRKKGAPAPDSVPVEKFKTSSGREYTF